MSGIAAALVLIGAAILVGLVVLVLLEPFRIDRTGDRFDYGLTDDDAPRDDSDWPSCGHPNHGKGDHDCSPFLHPYAEHQRRINGDT